MMETTECELIHRLAEISPRYSKPVRISTRFIWRADSKRTSIYILTDLLVDHQHVRVKYKRRRRSKRADRELLLLRPADMDRRDTLNSITDHNAMKYAR